MPRPGRPPKAATNPKITITIRPDQAEKAAALRKQKRLSGICQAAIDTA